MNEFIDIIRTKSIIGHSYKVKDTCEHLKLKKVNSRCIIARNNSSEGMLSQLKEIAIWTYRNAQDLEENSLTKEKMSLEKLGVHSESLHPPTKGYPRKISRKGLLTEKDYDEILTRMI